MSNTTTGLAMIAATLMLATSIARADIADEPFEEQNGCFNERSRVQEAAAQSPQAPDDSAYETARRNLAEAPKGHDTFQRRRLNEAIAALNAARATYRARIASRDATRVVTAKALAECVERERNDHLARVAAKRDERQRKADEEAAKRARLEELMSSKPVVQLSLSALICLTDNDRADALRAIADEKKYARIGGVQNNTKIYGLQQAIREADQRRARFSRELKTRKATAIKCSDPKVKQVATCITAPIEDGPCLADDVAGPLQVAHVIENGD